MAATYSIAVVGDWESVMGFRALGLDTYPVTSVEEARTFCKNQKGSFSLPFDFPCRLADRRGRIRRRSRETSSGG